MSIEAIGAPAPPVAMDDDLPNDSSKPAGLHSPPDSNKAVDADSSDSELSDLDEGQLEDALREDGPPPVPKEEEGPGPEPAPEPEPEVEDIGEILPDHWSGTVPVFKPTMKQFHDFKRFVRRLAP
jgi:hypothetical protein